MAELMDEERIANLVDALVTVLVKHLSAAVNDKRSEWPRVLGPAKMTPREAAEYIGVAESTLSQWRHHGDERQPKYIKPGARSAGKGGGVSRRNVMYLRKHLDEWLEQNTVDHSEAAAETRARMRRRLGL